MIGETTTAQFRIRRILFVSHKQTNCGVHQFGFDVAQVLQSSQRYLFIYRECDSPEDLLEAVKRDAPDAIIYNWHSTTLSWLTGPVVWLTDRPSVALIHEMDSTSASAMSDDTFDFFITPDPTLSTNNPIVFSTGRLIPKHRPRTELPARLTIGSFGFATPGKGFEALVALVNEQFDDCVIRLHLPPSDFFDPSGDHARALAMRCRALISKPQIDLVIDHDFFDRIQLIEFLAGNSMNAFLYEQQEGRGISSAVDFALAAERPIALRRVPMFRHLADVTPSIYVDDLPLSTILKNGFGHLLPLLQHWSPNSVMRDYERAMDRVFEMGARRSGVQRLLSWHRKTQAEREELIKTIYAGEAARQAIEAARKAREAAREASEEARQTSEEARQTSEEARQASEAALANIRKKLFPFRHPWKWMALQLGRLGSLRVGKRKSRTQEYECTECELLSSRLPLGV